MAVARRAARLHRRKAAHSAVLLVHLAVDFHNLTGGFGAAREQPAANHRVREGQRFDHIAALRYAAVGNSTHAEFASLLGARVQSGKLGNTDTRDHAGRTNRTGPLPDFDCVRAAFGEVFYARGVGYIAADNRRVGESLADCLYRIAYTLRKAVRSRDRRNVEPFVDELSDVCQDTVEVERSVGLSHQRDGRAAEEAELGVARISLNGGALVGNSFDIAEGEKPAQLVFVVYDQKLMDAEMFVEECVGDGNRVGAELLLRDRENVLALGHRAGDGQRRVAFLYDAAGEKPDEFVLRVYDGERTESEIFVGNQLQDVADVHFWRNLNRVLNKPVNVVLNARDFHLLLFLRHIAVDKPEPAVESHSDGHLRLRDRIHIGGYNRQGERDFVGNRGVQTGLARQNVGILGRERHVVVCKTESGVLCKERVGVQEECFVYTITHNRVIFPYVG